MIAPLDEAARAVLAPLVDAAPPLDPERLDALRVTLGIDQ